MKKNLTLTSIFILITTIVFGQTAEDRKGYIGISLGPSIPIGSFARDDANTGAIFDAHFAYKLKKNVGLAVLIRGQYLPVNVQSLTGKMRQVIPGVNTDVKGDGWSSGGLMAGIYSAYPLDQKGIAVFELKTLAGFMTTTSPQVDIRLSSSEGSGWVRQHSVSATAFSYLINAGMRFNAGKRMAFIVNADYLDYTPNFKNIKMTTSIGTQETQNMQEQIQTINISAGIVCRLR